MTLSVATAAAAVAAAYGGKEEYLTSTRKPVTARLLSRTFVPKVKANTGPIMGET